MFAVNRYGECIADDVEHIVKEFETYVRRRGLFLELPPSEVASQMMNYIQLRHSMHPLHISNPRNRPSMPEDWSEYDEELWLDYLDQRFTIESWQCEVMYPVFGSELHLWEEPCDGWRDELLDFLPWWISRSRKIIEELYPNPHTDEEDEDAAGNE